MKDDSRQPTAVQRSQPHEKNRKAAVKTMPTVDHSRKMEAWRQDATGWSKEANR
jgi:hypothetical protein